MVDCHQELDRHTLRQGTCIFFILEEFNTIVLFPRNLELGESLIVQHLRGERNDAILLCIGITEI